LGSEDFANADFTAEGYQAIQIMITFDAPDNPDLLLDDPPMDDPPMDDPPMDDPPMDDPAVVTVKKLAPMDGTYPLGLESMTASLTRTIAVNP